VKGQTYQLSFWAKGNAGTTLSARIYGSDKSTLLANLQVVGQSDAKLDTLHRHHHPNAQRHTWRADPRGFESCHILPSTW
jgi:hypothetical protein